MLVQKKVVLSLSGGVDSSTLLGMCVAQGYEVHAVLFTYGSKHNSYEEKAVEKVIAHYQKESVHPITFSKIDLSTVFALSGSHLLSNGGEIPEGHYEAPSMVQTVVPCRNLVFASVLASIAESVGASQVLLGVHAGDHVIYSDCREEFVEALDEAVQLATDGRVSVVAPYVNSTKAGIVGQGLRYEVPYELTRSCYKAQEIACGKCGTCVERLEAFAVHNVKDPIEYEK